MNIYPSCVFLFKSSNLINLFSRDWRTHLQNPKSSIYIKNQYTKYVINEDKDTNVCIIKWKPYGESSINRYNHYKCNFKILDGVFEETVYSNNLIEYNKLNTGMIKYIGEDSSIHKIKNLLNEPSFSLHVYPSKHMF